MSLDCSVVIPAYCEGPRIGKTVRAVREAAERLDLRIELLVVDDGSLDDTGGQALAAGAQVVTLDRNSGKGAALQAGFERAAGPVLVMLDGDLGESAGLWPALLAPVREGAEMSVARLTPCPEDGAEGIDLAGPGRRNSGGFGWVKGIAAWGLKRAGGEPMAAPLSGQRALTRNLWQRIGRLEPGFALEMGLNLDAIRLECRVQEVYVAFEHRYTGKDWPGFVHRGRQFRDILGCLWRRGLIPGFGRRSQRC